MAEAQGPGWRRGRAGAGPRSAPLFAWQAEGGAGTDLLLLAAAAGEGQRPSREHPGLPALRGNSPRVAPGWERRVLPPSLTSGRGRGAVPGVSGAAPPLPCVRQGRWLCRRSRSAPAGAPRAPAPPARRHRPPLRGAAGTLPAPSLRVVQVDAGTGPILSCASKLRVTSGFPELDPLFSVLKTVSHCVICTLGLLPTQAVVPNAAQVPAQAAL